MKSPPLGEDPRAPGDQALAKAVHRGFRPSLGEIASQQNFDDAPGDRRHLVENRRE
jgi:hypothetical protein